MRKVILFNILFFNFLLNAQINPEIAKSALHIEMLFPEGKTKALILSYDDGHIEDRRLVKLMNSYGLIGTFHLNSNKLGSESYLNKDEIKNLFSGHEVSVHTANHPFLTDLSKIDIVSEIVEDRKELEKLTDNLVRGMAYPFGSSNEKVLDAISGLGIEYARTVEDTQNFKIPSNFLLWHPTIHQFSKAFWKPNDAENDRKELDLFYSIINKFLEAKEVSLLDIWGHSWEFGDESKWTEIEKTFKMLSNNKSIYYAKQIDLVDYIHAFRNLKIAADKSYVLNTSSIAVFIKFKNKAFKIESGKMIHLSF